MALVSPGIQISINDQSQYVNSNVGSVPLVVLATAQDKTYNGAPAAGTSKANAGKLLSFSSQRDLITQMGTPTFQLSSAGTPVNGSEINEYGLLTAYSALGLSNQLYAIRADIDLNQLAGTSIRPLGAPADGTYWLDTANTVWGIEVLDGSTTTAFHTVTPLIITDPTQVSYQTVNTTNNVSTPIDSIGQIGNYALVFVDPDGTTPTNIRLFYKKSADSYQNNVPSNTWVEVGSPDWQESVLAKQGTVTNPVIPVNSTFTINTVTITTDGTVTTLGGNNGLVAKINSAGIPGVVANLSSTGRLQLFVTSAAKSNGATVDGKLSITDGTHSPMYVAGIVSTSTGGTLSVYCPILFYGNYASQPSGGWFASDPQPRPSGSIWWKQGALGGGLAPVLKQYNASLDQWEVLSVPAYSNYSTAIYGLDPTGGGINIAHGQVISTYIVPDSTYNSLRFAEQLPYTSANATGGAVGTFNSGDQVQFLVTAPGSSALKSYTVTVAGTAGTDFVTAVLGANIPYVTASYNANNTITVTHTTGGQINMINIGSGTAVADAGFVAGQGSGFTTISSTGSVNISNFTGITSAIVYESNTPYSAPETGTLWYYSNPAEVDIMINDGSGWKGYLNGGTDIRGYVLNATDPNGVIITANTAPTSQSTGAQLARGDLWLDSGDLANYPSLYRYDGSKWLAIDNTDHVSQNGIIFADARWDNTGTTDVVTGALPSTVTLLSSNYIDQDAPDYRLYPRGTLLFNTRRSGYNVKKFVSNYFNSTSFPTLPNVPGAGSSLPTVKDAWVTASGLDSNGVMMAGAMAQRSIVVSAMQSAVDSNLDALSLNYQFNLLVAPNYPEVIPNLLTLNDNRGDTAFVIGDTPMDLMPNTTEISSWINNTDGNGLPTDASASPYLALYYPAGRTNDLSGNQVVVPASHAVLRTFLYSDQLSYPWFAPAGLNRGRVTNLSDVGYIDSATGGFVHNAISQGLRDSLFTLGINPITQLPGTGLVVFGQLTRSGASTARNRVNVVRLENYLRRVFATVSNGYLFEPNDGVTRKSIATQIENTLNNVLSHRGLYDFLVICDSSNNTPATIANNQLYVDVAIEPERDVEFIYIPIAIYNPGSIAQLNTSST
jgi:Phage tail sheath C-terminal domain